MLEPPQHSPMQATHRPPYRPRKGQQQTSTACAGGPRAGHLVHMLSPLVGHPVHMLSPLVGHCTHNTERTPCQPTAPEAHSPRPTFPNTLVHPTTTQSRPLPIFPPTAGAAGAGRAHGGQPVVQLLKPRQSDRALQSLAEGEVLPPVAESPGVGQRPVSPWP